MTTEARSEADQSSPITLLDLVQTGHVAVLGRSWRNKSTEVYVHVIHIPFETDGNPIQESTPYTFALEQFDEARRELEAGKLTPEVLEFVRERLDSLLRGAMSSPGGVSYMDSPDRLGRTGEELSRGTR